MKDLYFFKLVISIPYLFLLSKINFLFFKYGAADQIPNPKFQIPNWHRLARTGKTPVKAPRSNSKNLTDI
jgi:hypothetical protein